MSQYRVDLDIFAGPLDLLLYLVRKDEVDIYDISIANITEQYIKYVEMLQMFDIELAGDFLVMAAALMEIKSAMLLPIADVPEEGQEDPTDPRADLIRQLLEYKKFKDAANLLGESSLSRKERYTRPDVIISKLKPTEEPELDLDQVSIWTLLEAFDTIMQATGNYDSYEHIKDDTPIDLYQIEILHSLQSQGPMTFQDCFKGRNNKLAMVGLFLAMLELIRNQLVTFEQPDLAGTIYLRSTTDIPAEQAVQDAIYANIDEEEQADQPEQTEEVPVEIEETAQTQTEEEVDQVAKPTKTPTIPIPIQELPAVKTPQTQNFPEKI